MANVKDYIQMPNENIGKMNWMIGRWKNRNLYYLFLSFSNVIFIRYDCCDLCAATASR